MPSEITPQQKQNMSQLRQQAATLYAELSAKEVEKDGIIVIPAENTFKVTTLMAQNPYLTLGAGVAVGVATTTMGARGVFGEGVQNLILGK